MPSPYAVRTTDFLSTLGVDTHINYTDGQYVDISRDLSALQYLGINRVRDAAPNPNFDSVGQRHLDVAADSGLLFTFYADDVDPSLVASRIHNFSIIHPGSVVGIEGPNEVNNWPVSYNGLSGTAGAQGYQQALYSFLKSDSVTKNIPVLGFTDWPVHASASDQNNIHPYAHNGDQPRDSIIEASFNQSAVDPGKPFSITETGYHTSLTADTNGGWEGVDEVTQAKLILNTYMDAADIGSKSTFVYQLLDAYPDATGSNQESHFGLFKLDYTPKLAAVAIHNLTSILSDSGANANIYAAGSLNYSVSGLPQAGHTYLTQKSNGSYQITVWNEPDVWNESTDQPINNSSHKTTINFGGKFGVVEVFDPLKSTAATITFHNVSSVDVDLTDHPLVVQIKDAIPLDYSAGSVDTAGDDTITIGNMANLEFTSTAPVYGGFGNDSITMTGTKAAFSVVGGEGSDTITVSNTGTTFITGGNLVGADQSLDGADQITVNGSGGTIAVFSNLGNDTVSAAGLQDTTTIQIYGGRGSDTITESNVSTTGKNSIFIAGGEDGDTISATGNGGALTIFGGISNADSTDAADNITIGTSSTGTLNLFANGGNDTVTIGQLGADSTTPATVYGGGGADSITIVAQTATSQTLTVFGNDGADTFAIAKGAGQTVTIADFKASEGDKLALTGLGGAPGTLQMTGGSYQSLQLALDAATNASGGTAGQSKAAAVTFAGSTYVVIDQGGAGFQASTDQAIKLTGVTDIFGLIGVTTIAA